MSDPLPSRGDGSAHLRSPIRPLWIFSIALVLASAASLVWSEYQWIVDNNGYSGTTPPPNFAAAQFIGGIAPSTLTGGIVCCGLALAMSALERIRAASADPLSVAPAVDAGTAGPAGGESPAIPSPAPARTAIDIETFKRPR